MPLWSKLRQTLLRESSSRLVDGEIVFLEDSGEKKEEQTLLIRKLRKLAKNFDVFCTKKLLTTKDLKETIHMLRESLSHFQKMEVATQRNRYRKMKAEEKKQ